MIPVPPGESQRADCECRYRQGRSLPKTSPEETAEVPVAGAMDEATLGIPGRVSRGRMQRPPAWRDLRGRKICDRHSSMALAADSALSNRASGSFARRRCKIVSSPGGKPVSKESGGGRETWRFINSCCDFP